MELMFRRLSFASLAGGSASALRMNLVPADGCTLLGCRSSSAMLQHLTSCLVCLRSLPAGHYKYPPAEIPTLLIQSGANLEAKDSKGRTALQVQYKLCCCSVVRLQCWFVM